MPRPGQPHSESARRKISKKNRSPEQRERHRQWSKDYWTPERRRAHGELTKEKMKDPAIRAKIAERTAIALADPAIRAKNRLATLAAWAGDYELKALNDAWVSARPEIRRKFLESVGVPELFAASSTAGKV